MQAKRNPDRAKKSRDQFVAAFSLSGKKSF